MRGFDIDLWAERLKRRLYLDGRDVVILIKSNDNDNISSIKGNPLMKNEYLDISLHKNCAVFLCNINQVEYSYEHHVLIPNLAFSEYNRSTINLCNDINVNISVNDVFMDVCFKHIKYSFKDFLDKIIEEVTLIDRFVDYMNINYSIIDGELVDNNPFKRGQIVNKVNKNLDFIQEYIIFDKNYNLITGDVEYSIIPHSDKLFITGASEIVKDGDIKLSRNQIISEII